MDNRTPGEEERPEYTPEEAALVMRFKIFGRMRWYAILGIIIATLVASGIFHIGFPTTPVYIICALLAAYNMVNTYQTRGLEKMAAGLVISRVRTLSNIYISLDLVTLTALLHFTGGIENPFIFLFVFHIVLASIALPYTIVYLLATSAIFMVALLVGLEYAGIVPHHNLAGFANPTLYGETSYILAVLFALAMVLYATTYMATAISGELRKRQREVVKLREQLLEQKTGELEKASKEIAKLEKERNRFLRFLGIAAHDLKAPLTAIQGFLWVMLGGYVGELTEKQRNMLERSSLRIKELLNLISNLLDIPRLEMGQIVQEMKEVSLSEIIKTCCDDWHSIAEEKGLKLEVAVPQSLPPIRGASSRLQQVMANLLDNGIRYTPEGKVTVRVTEKEKEIQVEVMDTGIGIPPQDLPRIFEDFFRGSNVETKGTGLGLSITKRIVESHGGKIWVESPCPETNKGCKFTFTLPKCEKAEATTERVA